MKTEHVTRMEGELADLIERTDKLTTFVNESPIFAGLAPIDQTLMAQQLAGMHQYRCSLELRVRRATSDSGDNSPPPPHP